MPEPDSAAEPAPAGDLPSLAAVAREWTRIGCTGFGGPPAHIALLRRLCVTERRWLTPGEFEDGVSATNLLPGPASTQLAILCAWRVRGRVGGVVGGVCFILPGLALIIALAALFLSGHPPVAIEGVAAGMGAAVAAVAVAAAAALVPASWRRAHRPGQRPRWVAYAAAGAASAIALGPYLVAVLIAMGLVEIVVRQPPGDRRPPTASAVVLGHFASGGLGALAWVALKVGALSYGGGFVIIPLMRADAVGHYHWLTNAGFLNAVALGQITPGPVVQTVAVVGYAAGGVGAALVAAVLAFAPSFVFVLGGAPHFERLRANPTVQALLDGTGPAAIGAIGGSSVVLAAGISHAWQLAILGVAAWWLLVLRRGVVPALLACAALGAVAALTGAPLT